MKKGLIQKLLPHFIAFVIFLVVALIYCKPVLQGEVLNQGDITQWKAMSKNSFDYKATHGHFPLWLSSMFSGMPAYQVAMDADVVTTPSVFYSLFTLGLPKPISFFFLACICFYFLSQVLRINPYIGIVGALAYAYATYNPIIMVAGHDTKMQSIALLPAFIASIILVYERRYLWGAALTALFSALLIGMNHLQIDYYGFLIAGFMTLGYMYRWIREKNIKHLLISVSIVVVCGLIGVLCNGVSIFTTYEYSKATIRGGTEIPDANATEKGVSKTYAFSYSMYKTEPFVLMVPKIYGGSDGPEIAQEDSKAIEQLQQMPQELGRQLQGFVRFYWGGIGGTQGPPYAGAIICFLALIGFFILDSKHKWWILVLSVLSIVMSWGGYFEGFNGMLLKILPLYNKFRAPSMIMIIPTFLFCMMAIMTLQKIVSTPDKLLLWKNYKKGLLLTAGVFIVLLMIYFSLDYMTDQDKSLIKNVGTATTEIKDYVKNFINGLKEDRRSLFFGSLTRSFLFIASAAVVLWFAVRKKMPLWATIGMIGLLSFVDVMMVDSKYLSTENYQEAAEYENNFNPSPADQQVSRDTGFYRVFDLRQGANTAFNGGAMTSYFHLSIGGYHPAKLSIYQDLIEHQLSRENMEQVLFSAPSSIPVVNMLNTKYLMFADPSGKMDTAIINPGALGAAWFVNTVRFESSAKAIMDALTNFSPKDTAIVFEKDKNLVNYNASADSSSSIQLVKHDNDEVDYTSNAATNRFAVFSEVFYDKGWKAYIDDKEAPIIRTNYVLRGLSVPAGKHNIRFVFHPDSYYTGIRVSTITGLIVFLLLIAAIFMSYRNRKKQIPETEVVTPVAKTKKNHA